MLTLLLTLSFGSAFGAWEGEGCVKVSSRVQDPSSHYHTTVFISGTNTCSKTIDLSNTILKFDTNYEVSSLWGTAGFALKHPPEYDGTTVTVQLSSGGWQKPLLNAGGHFEMQYGVTMSAGKTLTFDNLMFLPPPNDDGRVYFNVYGDERIVRPVNIHMRSANDVASDERVITATHLNMGEMQSFEAKKVIHGQWTIEVNGTNGCRPEVNPRSIEVSSEEAVNVTVTFDCDAVPLTMLTVAAPAPHEYALPDFKHADIDVTLWVRLENGGESLVNMKRISWNGRAVFSRLPYDTYTIRASNFSRDGKRLVYAHEQVVTLDASATVANVALKYDTMRVPMILVDVVMQNECDNETMVTVHTSR